MQYRINIPDWLDGPLIRLALLYRRLRYGYPFRRIPLTQGKYAIVDPDDYEQLNKYKWYAARCKNTFYAGRHTKTGKDGKRIYIKMHRQVINPPWPLVVDHINRYGFDNRKANLRPATRSQNNLNKSFIKTKPSSSKYRGVSWYKRRKIWHVQVGINGKFKFIGYFHNEIEAAKAYDQAARKYHKEFAVLNFPLDS